jgi:hypothetical protein
MNSGLNQSFVEAVCWPGTTSMAGTRSILGIIGTMGDALTISVTAPVSRMLSRGSEFLVKSTEIEARRDV